MTSVVQEELLNALDIVIPVEANNVYAALQRQIHGAKITSARFKCYKCSKHFTCLSSFFLVCRGHLHVVGLREDFPSLIEMHHPDAFRIKRKRILYQQRTMSIKYTCKQCLQFFSTNFEYLDHLECHKHPSMRVCQICKQRFPNGIRARAHARKKHPELHRIWLAERHKLKAERFPKRIHNIIEDNIAIVEEEEKEAEPDNEAIQMPESPQPVKVGKGRPRKGSKQQSGMSNEQTKYRDCIICDQKHMTLKSLKKHSLRHSFYDTQINCTYCQYSIVLDATGNTSLKKHMWLAHRVKFVDVIKEKTKREVEQGETQPYFHCPVCFFPTHPVQSHLDFHVEIFHGVGLGVKCRFCPAKFNSKQEAVAHEWSEHGKNEDNSYYICDLCEHRYRSITGIKNHLERHRMNVPLFCEKTSGRSEQKKRQNLKVVRAEPAKRILDLVKDGEYACEYCGICLSNSTKLDQHQRLFHDKTAEESGDTQKCHFCGLVAPSMKLLWMHYRQDHGIGMIPRKGEVLEQACQCRLCGKKFSMLDKCRSHELYHMYLDEVVVCTVCGQRVRTRMTLKQHMKSHEPPAEKVRCNWQGCNKTYPPQALRRHIRRQHTLEEAHPCRECDLNFKSWSARHYHETQVHGIKRVPGEMSVAPHLPQAILYSS